MNKIFCPHSDVNTLANIEHLNFSNNQIEQLGQSMTMFRKLLSLDLSHNHLSEKVDPEEFSSLPQNLERLVLTENLWVCIPTLSWVSSWSLSLRHLHPQLRRVQCRIRNSYQMAPLLGNNEPRPQSDVSTLIVSEVARTYSRHVNPRCSLLCSCVFHYFGAGSDSGSPPSYTVIVNCTNSGLRYFPTIPYRTTVLDLSHNNLTSYTSLSPETQNYQYVSSLILSHNRLTYIDTKLLQMKLDKQFKADHNFIKEIPFDISQLLQKYLNNEIMLGHNPWSCYCNAEIKDMVRLDNHIYLLLGMHKLLELENKNC